MKKFTISSIQNEVLNWAFGLFLAFSAVSMIDHWTGTPSDNQNPFTAVFESLQSLSGIQIAEAVLLLCTQLVMWELMRRQLNKLGHFFLQLSVLVVMVLSVLSTAASCYPVSQPNPELMQPISQTELVIRNFIGYSDLVVWFINLFLGIGIARKFRGSVRLYGLSLFLAPLVSLLSTETYTYIYNNVGGVTQTDIITYGTIATLITFVMGLLPFVMQRVAMKSE